MTDGVGSGEGRVQPALALEEIPQVGDPHQAQKSDVPANASYCRAQKSLNLNPNTAGLTAKLNIQEFPPKKASNSALSTNKQLPLSTIAEGSAEGITVSSVKPRADEKGAVTLNSKASIPAPATPTDSASTTSQTPIPSADDTQKTRTTFAQKAKRFLSKIVNRATAIFSDASEVSAPALGNSPPDPMVSGSNANVSAGSAPNQPTFDKNNYPTSGSLADILHLNSNQELEDKIKSALNQKDASVEDMLQVASKKMIESLFQDAQPDAKPLKDNALDTHVLFTVMADLAKKGQNVLQMKMTGLPHPLYIKNDAVDPMKHVPALLVSRDGGVSFEPLIIEKDQQNHWDALFGFKGAANEIATQKANFFNNLRGPNDFQILPFGVDNPPATNADSVSNITNQQARHVVHIFNGAIQQSGLIDASDSDNQLKPEAVERAFITKLGKAAAPQDFGTEFVNFFKGGEFKINNEKVLKTECQNVTNIKYKKLEFNDEKTPNSSATVSEGKAEKYFTDIKNQLDNDPKSSLICIFNNEIYHFSLGEQGRLFEQKLPSQGAALSAKVEIDKAENFYSTSEFFKSMNNAAADLEDDEELPPVNVNKLTLNVEKSLPLSTAADPVAASQAQP